MTDQTANVPAVREQHSLKEVAIQNHAMGAHLMPQNMADVVRFSEVMARGGIAIKKHLRDNPGACLSVVLQALDWGMNPISVANKSYAVNDSLAYEAQLINAVVLARAPIKKRPKYAWDGEPGKTRRCTVSVIIPAATDEDEDEVLTYTSPEVQKITVKNSPLWKADEDQQLGYFAIRSLARRHFPDIILGVYDVDEAASMRDVTPRHRETTGLRERLQSQRLDASDKGFSQAGVEEAIDGEFEDTAAAEVEPDNALPADASGDASEGLDEALGGDDLPEGLKAAGEPESGPGEATIETVNVLDVDMEAATVHQIAAWVEGFRACGLRLKDRAALMELWRAHYDRVTILQKRAPQRYAELEAWMEQRMKALRKKEAQ